MRFVNQLLIVVKFVVVALIFGKQTNKLSGAEGARGMGWAWGGGGCVGSGLL